MVPFVTRDVPRCNLKPGTPLTAPLREGDRVAVLGRAVQQPDPTVSPTGLRQPVLRVVLADPPDPVIVSNESGAWS